MQPLLYWCISSGLVLFAVVGMTLALLRAGGQNRFKNRRIAEVEWQVRNQNTDWWLDINKPDKPANDE